MIVRIMSICMCKGVTERALREAAGEGTAALRWLIRTTGMGSDCGCCMEAMRETVAAVHAGRYAASQGGGEEAD
ncbi:(2Fe-2S)-binding protein [Inmirania thermothiophila]|uniref:Bacterioferritin-associated ferredoxin n=1 Tax=Inmirania thermothiophila TaxID=1750597 RepID=A0A3N1Y0U3_9GAMM|nr:(2Fe-2S)-binding protein [Inmirania thermothiophila]ROR32453.1 bacterioferritin-associated ferredoxin [Inmirania thermothiophila]